MDCLNPELDGYYSLCHLGSMKSRLALLLAAAAIILVAVGCDALRSSQGGYFIAGWGYTHPIIPTNVMRVQVLK